MADKLGVNASTTEAADAELGGALSLIARGLQSDGYGD
jgi:hypothetical protein